MKETFGSFASMVNVLLATPTRSVKEFFSSLFSPMVVIPTPTEATPSGIGHVATILILVFSFGLPILAFVFVAARSGKTKTEEKSSVEVTLKSSTLKRFLSALWSGLRKTLKVGLRIVVILAVLFILAVASNPRDRNEVETYVRSHPPVMWWWPLPQPEVKQLSGVAEHWKFCFWRNKSLGWECSENGNQYIATIKEYIPNKVLSFEVCWGGSCSSYMSDLDSSTHGEYKNAITGAKGRWTLPLIEGGSIEGTAVGVEGEEVGTKYKIRLNAFQ